MGDNGQTPSSPRDDGLTTDITAPCIPNMVTPCCCRNEDCSFQRQNYEDFAKLDQALKRAGIVGQALLARHEAYVNEAEDQRALMDAEIAQLAQDKIDSELKNASLIEENRSLLDQLEGLNNVNTESDQHVRTLTATLQTTQTELHRLKTLAARTEQLEKEIEEYEQEQTVLQASLTYKTESEKAATLRWQASERKLAAMENQMEDILREQREEKERHVEIVGRMERQRVVEKELETAAGRLKGAAAAKTMSRDKHGSTVVSHFVKDILQDNANLQTGIVELRDMLNNSNEQVERLREQLAHFAPPDDNMDDLTPSNAATNLGQELNRASMQELHVHHHYHAPEQPKRTNQTLRRPKKKRNVLTSGLFTPSTGSRTPRSSMGAGPYTQSAATVLSQTSASIPQRTNNRWSMQSAVTADSILSSPRSLYPPSSIWDRNYSESVMDSSRPTTPDSEGPGSPVFLPQHSKRCSSSGSYFRSLPPTSYPDGNSDRFEDLDSATDEHAFELEGSSDPDLASNSHGRILEEDEGDNLDSAVSTHDQGRSTVRSFLDDTEVANYSRPSILDENIYSRPLHRRAASHESLISISGMDIHTLRSRPSQLLTAQSTRTYSSQATVTATLAHAARPELMPRASSSSGRSILQGMAADQRINSTQAKNNTSSSSIGQKVGGWVFGRWGSTPTPTVTVSAPMDHIKNKEKRLSAAKLRPPGINQAGPILGVWPEEVHVPRTPVLTTLNEEELRQSLNE